MKNFNENFQWKISMEGFARKCCSTVNTPFIQRTDFWWKKLPQDNNTNSYVYFQAVEVSFHKKNFWISTLKHLFLFHQVDVSMRWSAIEQISWVQKWCVFPSVSYMRCLFMNLEGLCQIIRNVLNIYIYLNHCQ